MKFEEALKLMREGKKMTTDHYKKGNYFYINFGELFFYDSKEKTAKYGPGCLGNDIVNGGWYEYKESILTEKEKTYLENVIRPFKDEVKTISHLKDIRFQLVEYISIYINCFERICLPNFSAGTMYKGMELNKKYTIEELGLFEKEN